MLRKRELSFSVENAEENSRLTSINKPCGSGVVAPAYNKMAAMSRRSVRARRAARKKVLWDTRLILLPPGPCQQLSLRKVFHLIKKSVLA
jgi:hypothetical protein